MVFRVVYTECIKCDSRNEVSHSQWQTHLSNRKENELLWIVVMMNLRDKQKKTFRSFQNINLLTPNGLKDANFARMNFHINSIENVSTVHIYSTFLDWQS